MNPSLYRTSPKTGWRSAYDFCVACLEAQERENKQKGRQNECNGTMSTGVKIPLRRSAPA